MTVNLEYKGTRSKRLTSQAFLRPDYNDEVSRDISCQDGPFKYFNLYKPRKFKNILLHLSIFHSIFIYDVEQTSKKTYFAFFICVRFHICFIMILAGHFLIVYKKQIFFYDKTLKQVKPGLDQHNKQCAKNKIYAYKLILMSKILCNVDKKKRLPFTNKKFIVQIYPPLM